MYATAKRHSQTQVQLLYVQNVPTLIVYDYQKNTLWYGLGLPYFHIVVSHKTACLCLQPLLPRLKSTVQIATLHLHEVSN